MELGLCLAGLPKAGQGAEETSARKECPIQAVSSIKPLPRGLYIEGTLKGSLSLPPPTSLCYSVWCVCIYTLTHKCVRMQRPEENVYRLLPPQLYSLTHPLQTDPFTKADIYQTTKLSLSPLPYSGVTGTYGHTQLSCGFWGFDGSLGLRSKHAYP